MSSTGLEVLDTVQETNHWLRLMIGQLGANDRRAAFNALRAGLHAVRDRIGMNNAVHLGAQLPMLRRGAYYESWIPSLTPTRERRLEGFIEHVSAYLPRNSRLNPAEVARACCAVMGHCLDGGEMLKLWRLLPHEQRNRVRRSRRPTTAIRCPSWVDARQDPRDHKNRGYARGGEVEPVAHRPSP